MEEANITLQPTPCDTPVPSLPSEDMPQLPQYAAAPANQAPENVGSLDNYGAGHMRPQVSLRTTFSLIEVPNKSAP